MAEQDRESYKYLQIDRPILAGGDRFLLAVSEIGKRALGGKVGTAITETHLEVDEDTLDLRTTHRPVSQSRLDVYSPHDLKTVILRRVASSKMSNRYNFNHQAASLTAKRKAGPARRSVPHPRPGKSAKDVLDEISTDHGLDADNTRIKFDRITEGFDPILGRFVALVPKSGIERFALTKQAELAFKLLDELSPRIAHGSNPTIPAVPFATLPSDIGPQQYERLMDEISSSEILPVNLVMGGVDIYTNSTVPRQTSFEHDDD